MGYRDMADLHLLYHLIDIRKEYDGMEADEDLPHTVREAHEGYMEDFILDINDIETEILRRMSPSRMIRIT